MPFTATRRWAVGKEASRSRAIFTNRRSTSSSRPVKSAGATATKKWLGEWRVQSISMRLLFLSFLAAAILPAQTYDLVIANGRVIDPETNLDGVRSIGINGGAVA